jgi:hypothetical protein
VGVGAGVVKGGRGCRGAEVCYFMTSTVRPAAIFISALIFFRAPIAYSIFRALKYHVCCHRCDNIGRGCATWEASIN